MPTRFAHAVRYPNQDYGSVFLAVSQRIGAGSTFTSDDVDVTRDRIKSFGARGNIQGSVFLDVTFGGTNQFFTYAQGTFPAGQGSVKTLSSQESFRRMRVGIRLSSVGSASAFYGGQSQRLR